VVAAVVGGVYPGIGGADSQPADVQAIEQPFEAALVKAQATSVLRVHWLRSNGPPLRVLQPAVPFFTPRLVTAVEWVDLTNGDQRWLYYDSSNHLVIENSRARSSASNEATKGSRNIVTVSFSWKRWSLASGGTVGCDRCAPQPSQPVPDAACNCDLDPFTNTPYSPPQVTIVGQEIVDGQPTFHLNFVVVTGAITSTVDLWIDSFTYLPVHEQVVGYGMTTINDFEWLPRTSANLRQFKVVIPHGFKRVYAS
jgi:hypothetical protein